MSQTPGNCRKLVSLAVLGLSLVLGAPSHAQDSTVDLSLLAVSACPPYRLDVPPQVCINAVHSVADGLGEALDIQKDHIVKLTGQMATGPNVLDAIRQLAENSGPEDYLIFFLSGHGGTYSEWARFSADPQDLREINKTADTPLDYILVFWSDEKPAVPALSLKEQIYVPASALLDALDLFKGKYGIILDSCSSNLAFEQFVKGHHEREKFDFLLTSAGSNQISNINFAGTAPLFTENLVKALDAPSVVFLGEAIDHARAMTTMSAVGVCSSLTIPIEEYSLVFPRHPKLKMSYKDEEVGLPFWYCSQVPSVHDTTGFLSNLRLRQIAE